MATAKDVGSKFIRAKFSERGSCAEEDCNSKAHQGIEMANPGTNFKSFTDIDV